MAEADLAAVVADWLRAQHWEVYPEVQLASFGRRADLVALQNNRTWVVECKMSLSMEVIAQADWWRHETHWASIAVPAVSQRRIRSKGRGMAQAVLRWRGIGLIIVSRGDSVQSIPPALNRGRLAGRTRDGLCEAQQAFGVAGSKDQFWTPFKQTVRGLTGFVREHPGCTMKEAIDGIEHHYAKDTTARGCMGQWIAKGIVPGIERRWNGKRLELHIADAKDQPHDQ